MSSIEVVPTDDAARFLATDRLVWFDESLAAPAEDQLVALPADQRFAALREGADPTTYPGVYGVYPLELAVPGEDDEPRLLPCAGLTWVGVHPDHRRRGVLTAMIRHHLERVHETPGTSISALHASEPAIYGRYGYGLASLELTTTLSRGTTLTAPGLEDAASAVTTQVGTVTDAGVPQRMRDCHRATVETGAVVGAVGYYEQLCQQFPERTRDREPWRVLFARRDGRDVGFAMFRREQKWVDSRPAGRLEAFAVIGEPAARLALLRRLVDFDLVATVSVRTVGLDDPLLHWAGGPRATAGVATYDSLWVRLVDLPEALIARAWNAACDVVVDVADTHAPWNEGRWRIHADASGAAEVERTTADADLRLTADALGSAYLGGGNLAVLARTGHLTEARPGAARDLWRALRTDAAPAASVMF